MSISDLPQVPWNDQLIGDNGKLTPIWADWFKELYFRNGRERAFSNSELYDELYEIDVANRIDDGDINFAKLLGTDWTLSGGASGYQKLGSGLYVQWGVTSSVASGATESVAFGTSMPNNLWQAYAGVRDNSAVATTATGQWGTGNYTTSGFDIYNRTSVALTFNWWAVGN